MMVCRFDQKYLKFNLKKFISGYKEEDILDDHCQQFCNQWLSFLGIQPHKTLTLHSAFNYLILIFTLAVWMYTYLEMKHGDSTEALHRICLSLLALGLFSIQFFKHEEIMSVAKQIDDCFSYSNSDVKPFFKRRQKDLFTSGMKIYTDLFTIIVFTTWGSILANLYKEQLFVADVKPPIPMILPIESKFLHYFVYFSETCFVVIASIADVLMAHLFMMFTLQLTANFEVLCLNLNSMNRFMKNDLALVLDSEIMPKIKVNIRHHQEIFKSFNSIKKLFDQIFYILYFSMMSAIAMCRTLLVGDIDIKHLLPLFYLETGYIHIFCHFADMLAEESANVRIAAYSTPWYTFSSNVCTSLRIMVIRALKPPKLYFFIGGSDISCATFTLVSFLL
ncbi:unnamed protein product [Nezara viridula]|uniref:Odorant receptor n=1 Tax=Nezara viridula TaxID=85310 RepID=A0A9P0MXB5_NEZVI|nr:unnamed protein product [Nezara viridula]